MHKAFERYLYGPGVYSKEIRNTVAHIASLLPEGTDVIKAVVRIMVNSFKTMNATIRQNGHKGGPPRHLLLNVGTGGKGPTVAAKKKLSPASVATMVCQSLVIPQMSH
jgi:hypothetical protein